MIWLKLGWRNLWRNKRRTIIEILSIGGSVFLGVVWNNLAVGSYDQMTKWIETLHKGTGLWVWMWQVAIGNTYFKTCNQTDGHYCDGIAQSIFT